MLNAVNDALFLSSLHTFGLSSIAALLLNLWAAFDVAAAPLVSRTCGRDMMADASSGVSNTYLTR